MNESQQSRQLERKNLRTALILGFIALAFFLGVMVKYWLR